MKISGVKQVRTIGCYHCSAVILIRICRRMEILTWERRLPEQGPNDGRIEE